MSKRKRRHLSAEFKARIAKEALLEVKGDVPQIVKTWLRLTVKWTPFSDHVVVKLSYDCEVFTVVSNRKLCSQVLPENYAARPQRERSDRGGLAA